LVLVALVVQIVQPVKVLMVKIVFLVRLHLDVEAVVGVMVPQLDQMQMVTPEDLAEEEEEKNLQEGLIYLREELETLHQLHHHKEILVVVQIVM
jgi:hypothetical protein